MSVQVLFVCMRPAAGEAAREAVADIVSAHDGFILMTTSEGALIIAVDEVHAERVRAHPEVDFVNGLTLDPNGAAARELQALFAQNIATQLSGRPRTPSRHPQDAEDSVALPPAYRPWAWRQVITDR